METAIRKIIVVGIIVVVVVAVLVFQSQELLFGSHSKEATSLPPSLSEQKSLESSVKRELSEEEKVARMSNALRVGTLEALQAVRQEILVQIPGYQERILPILKYHALNALIVRFEERDWRAWPEYELSDDYSRAKHFVDDLTLVNPQLGRFVNIASYLLHGLFIATNEGRVFYSSEYEELLHRAKPQLGMEEQGTFSLLSPAPAITVRSEQMVSDELPFRRIFEEQRCRLCLKYIDTLPQEVNVHLRLLGATNPEYCPKTGADVVIGLIHRVMTVGTAKLREEVISRELEHHTLEKFGERYAGVKKGLAQLFVAGALDAVSLNDLSRARALAEHSRLLFGGLESQVRLTELMQRKSDTRVVADRATPEAESVELLASPSSRLSTSPKAKFEGESTVASEVVSSAGKRSLVQGLREKGQSEEASSFGWGSIILAITLLIIFGTMIARYAAQRWEEFKFFRQVKMPTVATGNDDGLTPENKLGNLGS